MRSCWMRLLLLALMQPARGDDYHPEPSLRPGLISNADADSAERGAPYWYSEAFSAIDERLAAPAYDEVARNVVLFLGDGLSVPTMAAARALRGQRANRPGEDERLHYERFPVTGLAKTYCVDYQVADSACSSTAYLCGVKANSGTMGVTAAVKFKDCLASTDNTTHLESIAAWALADGRSAGIVTNARVTDASPGGVYANIASRKWHTDGDIRAAGHDPAKCPDISDQLINSYPGNQFQVILGGGRGGFLPNDTTDEDGKLGSRWDNRDLIQEWRAQREKAGQSHAYVWNRTALLGAIADPPDYLLGLFNSGTMEFAAVARKAVKEPTLAEMTEAAIRVLSKNPRGFFLFVEGALIDKAHHENRAHLALDETLRLDDAVARADSLLPRSSTLLVLTADHAHAMTYSGYSRRGTNIVGPSDTSGQDKIPYMTLSYANGPGHRAHVNGKRVDVTAENNFGSLNWKSHAEVPIAMETHGGDDVAVFARGPQQMLFTGSYEQSQIPHLMGHAACLGPAGRRRDVCNGASALAASILVILAMIPALLV